MKAPYYIVMMKKILLWLLLSGIFSAVSMAQNLQDRWFCQILGGLNNTGTETLSMGHFKNNIGYSAGVSLGYMINPYISLYAQSEFNRLHSKTLSTDYVAPNTYFAFNCVEPSFNLSWNLTNTFLGYKEDRRNALSLFGGGAGAFASKLAGGFEDRGYFSHNETVYGYRAGLEYVHHFNDGWGLVVQGVFQSFPDKLDGITNGGMDSHVNLMIGIRKSFGKRMAVNTVWGEPVVRERVVTEVRRDTVVVDRVEDKDTYAIFFEIDKIIIRDSQVSKIQAMANYMKANPEKVVFMFGYADDNTGTKARNAWLAENRARVIKEELMNKYGIDESRIITHHQGDVVQPYPEEEFWNNRATVCVVTDLER